jgi:predicted O-methyltransferase YrrM
MTNATTSNSTPNREFFARAFGNQGPKVWNGFSRPLYHNVMGLLHGHKFSKMGYGGMIRHTEAAMLTKWAGEIPEGGTIVEIGCYGGLSTSYLCLGASRRRGRIYSIDPFDSDLDKQAQLTDHAVALENKPTRAMVRQRLEALGAGDRVELIEGYSQEVVKTWNRPIDFLWIDGNHDQAWQDYQDWAPFLNPRARVGLHDAHPRYGILKVAEDAQRIFSSDEWEQLEHVKSIITGVRTS